MSRKVWYIYRTQYSAGKAYRVGIGEVSLNPRAALKSFGSPDAVDFTLKILAGISSGVVAKWLWEKLHGKTISRLRINRREIQLDKGEITRIIEETLDIDD